MINIKYVSKKHPYYGNKNNINPKFEVGDIVRHKLQQDGCLNDLLILKIKRIRNWRLQVVGFKYKVKFEYAWSFSTRTTREIELTNKKH